jgi:hypothetical protein
VARRAVLEQVAPCSLRTCPLASNEPAAAFGHAVSDSDWYPADFNRWVSSDYFVNAMWLTSRVMLRAIDFITKSGDGKSVDGMHWRAADDFSAMVRGIAYYDDFVSHFAPAILWLTKVFRSLAAVFQQ